MSNARTQIVLGHIRDHCHRVANGGLDGGGRKATIGDLKEFIRSIRDEAITELTWLEKQEEQNASQTE